MPAPSTQLSRERLIQIAKGPLVAYSKKDWDAVRASITPDFVYDEVATRRKATGIEQVMNLWQGWATALPDSKATFHGTFVSGTTVILEVTWQGTHTGLLQTANGEFAATGKRIDVRACNVIEVSGEKAKLQRQYFDMGTLLEQLGIKT